MWGGEWGTEGFEVFVRWGGEWFTEWGSEGCLCDENMR